MSHEHGKQLSIEEAVQSADTKSIGSPIQEPQDERKTRAGSKATATSKHTKDKQLALEETVGEDIKKSKSNATKIKGTRGEKSLKRELAD